MLGQLDVDMVHKGADTDVLVAHVVAEVCGLPVPSKVPAYSSSLTACASLVTILTDRWNCDYLTIPGNGVNIHWVARDSNLREGRVRADTHPLAIVRWFLSEATYRLANSTGRVADF